jgi:glucokinase
MRTRVLQQGTHEASCWLASPGITIKRIFESYESDETARSVVDETVQVIGLAGANLVTALNPDAFVLGGYVTESGPSLTAAVRAKIRQYAFDAAAHRVSVVRAQLGADAGVRGAVELALAS